MAVKKASGARDVAETTKTGTIRTRIDPALKLRAETILGKLGLNGGDAIRLFYSQIVLVNGLPFPAEVPNAATREAMKDADDGKLTRHRGAGEMFEDMGI